jgi:hypothetical protein
MRVVKIWDIETIEPNKCGGTRRELRMFQSFFENHLNIVGRRRVINKETVEGAAGVYYDEYILKGTVRELWSGI